MTEQKARRRAAAFLTSQYDDDGNDSARKTGARAAAMKHSFHAIVIQSFAACLIVMMLTYVMTFWAQTDVRFMLVIAIGFLLIYIALPLLMLRFEHEKNQTIRAFLRRRIKICYGDVTGMEIVLQVCLIPFMLCLCTILICVTLVMLRP